MQTNRRLVRRLKQAEGHTVGRRCACQSALGILRGYLSFPSLDAARSAPPCPHCGRPPWEAAQGSAVNLYVGLDTKAV